jgi:N-succinyldiaminopimelate aminotransferase
MHTNPHLETLPDFPFDKLRNLLEGIDPPAGLDPISLAIGEPQQPVPGWVGTIIADNGHLWNKYPPFAGSDDLRNAIAGFLRRRYSLTPDQIDPMKHLVACAGTREAIYLLPTWAVPHTKGGGRPIVAMPNPFYHVYGTAALASGAESLYMSVTEQTGYLPDLDSLDADTLKRLAILFICSPANPQGVVADAAYLERAINMARQHDFLLAVDECYAEIYDRDPPLGALQVCRDMADQPSGMFNNVIVFHSLSKRSNGAGVRSGFLAGDQAIIEAHGRFRSYISATIPGPIDAASAALWDDDDHVSGIRAFYRRNIDTAEQVLGDRFGFYRPEGGFFLWLDVGNGEEATKTLWGKAGVKVLPGAHTSRVDGNGLNPGDRYIRLALVNDAGVIREACERLVKVL